MNGLPERIVYSWLRKLSVPVSFNFLEAKLCSHYDYPSLLSVTDTLDTIGIEHTAIVVDKARINELPVPFLAFAYTNGENFTIINYISQLKTSSEEFKNWSGVLIAAEIPEQWNNKENDAWLNKERKNKISRYCITGFFFCLSFLPLIGNYSTLSLIMLLLSVAGLFVAFLVVMHELGYKSSVADHLCGSSHNNNCEAVIKSKGSALPFGFKWSDAGIIYFSAQFLALVTALLSNSIIPVQGFLSILSVLFPPFTFYSVYYQKKIVRRWCTLCLLTVCILWMQFGVLSPLLFTGTFSRLSVQSIAMVLFSFLFTTVLWSFLLKPVLAYKNKSKTANFKLLRFKNDPEIFEVLLKHQDRVNISPFEEDIQLGNADAPLQIVVACNPYCPPCAGAHKELHRLLQNNIGLTVRFAVDAGNREDSRTQAVEYILKCVSQKGKGQFAYKARVIHEWYNRMDLESFASIYPLSEEPAVDELLKQHDQWAKDAKIEATPTIFINGFKMPKQYRVEDLQLFIDQLKTIDKEESEKLNNKSPEGINSLLAQTR